MTARDKDRILAEIMAYKPHQEIEGLAEVLPELEYEGYVEVWWDVQHKPIRVKLSDKGKVFIANGGYAMQSRERVKVGIKKSAKRILEDITIFIISFYLGWLLKGCTPDDNTAPSSPEPSETHSLNRDSTRLSTESSLVLNEDSAASRAKSRAVISESSASTRRNDATAIPLTDTSAIHSSSIKPSSASPSGK